MNDVLTVERGITPEGLVDIGDKVRQTFRIAFIEFYKPQDELSGEWLGDPADGFRNHHGTGIFL